MIYYVFDRLTGEFAGSGTPFFDNEQHGCTEIATPDYDHATQIPVWNGDNWDLKELENI